MQIPAEAVGGKVKCPTCGRVIVVGTAARPKPPVAPPPAVEHDELEVIDAVEVVADDLPEVLPADEQFRPPGRRKQGGVPADCLLLRAREFLIAARTASSASLNYEIFDAETDKQLAYAAEDSPGSQGVLEVMGADKASFPCTVTVYDARSETEVFTIQRGAFRKFMGINPPHVDIFDGSDRVLGSFDTHLIPAKGDFWIYDAHDREFAEIDGQWHPQVDYAFRNADGVEIAQVVGEGQPRALFNMGFSWCKRGGQLLLTLEEDFTNSPEAKLLLVASTLAMELLMASFKLRVGH
jgi:hypothetical protein